MVEVLWWFIYVGKKYTFEMKERIGCARLNIEGEVINRRDNVLVVKTPDGKTVDINRGDLFKCWKK